MQVQFSYRKRSAITSMATGVALALEPNLRRDRVSFCGQLRDPLRFREAMCALHDVVISDLRYKPRDDSAHQAYKAQQHAREESLRRAAYSAKKEELKALQPQPLPPGLEAQFNRLRRKYWRARDQYSNYLYRHDPELWRMMMPCDPVITVAPDAIFFECFSADESSYGCLTVSRDAFTAEGNVALGTTNVDYTWDLYEHFQKLRSYRQTRFEIDPSGFEVTTTQAAGHREERIDLPSSWLRGFMQLQAAMSLPQRRIRFGREGLYNLLAWLKRHRARRSPRALRFELDPSGPCRLVLEPWEQAIALPGAVFSGPKPEVIRTWGRDRLRVLARLLPLADALDVYLLGTGLPSFWSVQMGEMRLLLGLSGWTKNDWTGPSALDQILPPVEVDDALLVRIAQAFRASPALSFGEVCSHTMLPGARAAAGLNRLALLGQVIHDLPLGQYRWRQVMPTPLTLAQIGPENPETAGARRLLERNEVTIVRDQPTPAGLRLLTGRAPGRDVEVVVDADGRLLRGKCTCSHHFQFGLRRGPCQHLQALRNKALAQAGPGTLDKWFSQFWS